ncbi:hypothetical protein MA16_Dca025708 [Dendrobium catenatum]|uniref:RNase H type-1 domain-containing protein n=1 Tax=Dendrobium catenatum TaxID=906689 RepID=A0A2I0X4V5_9ASPA|nr:hypothetical protein MA16_Dca025708 [Dendrobium catenatum]
MKLLSRAKALCRSLSSRDLPISSPLPIQLSLSALSRTASPHQAARSDGCFSSRNPQALLTPDLLFLSDLTGDDSLSSFQLSEDDEHISECSFIFSEDHENDILKCSVILFENHDEDDEFLVRVFSKGVSVSENCDLGSKISGIGVVMQKPHGVPFLQVHKKLDFFVEELIAEHLALMDGLLEALRNGLKKLICYDGQNKNLYVIKKMQAVMK